MYINAQERILTLLNSVKRDGIKNLIQFLESSDFFDAPASLKLHHAHEGGLCEYALARYDALEAIVSSILPANAYDEDTLIIVSLLADVNKINYFERTSINKKQYCEDGDKQDNIGRFKWVAEAGYKIKDPEDRFVFGTSGQNAERIITDFIPLKDEESAAIINLGVTYENPMFNYSYIYKKYKLACLLSAADSIATYLDDEAPF